MDTNIFKNKKILISVAIIAVILIIVWAVKSPSQEAAPGQQETAEQGAVQSGSGAQTTTGSKAATPIQPKTTVTTVQKTGISMVSPAAGEVWSMGKVHTIRWTHEEGHTGSISLIDASSKAVIGWISANLSAQQVTYDWDTLRASIARTDPSKKDIQPGTYIIRVAFDAVNTKVESAPFQIISASGTDIILNREVYIRNGIFIPNFIEVKKGERVVMINDDGNNTRTIKTNGVAIAKLVQRDSYVFPIAQTGKYEFGLVENAISKLTISAN